MVTLENEQKFKKLCSDLRTKKIFKTNDEIFEIMIELTKQHFSKLKD